MKKYVCIIILLSCIIGCSKKQTSESVQGYDFELLRDSLGLPDDCIFVEECSPLYTDDNPYHFNEATRTKAIFFRVFPSKYDYWDEPDTVVCEVLRNNEIVFAGRNQMNASAKELIDWIINNREKN